MEDGYFIGRMLRGVDLSHPGQVRAALLVYEQLRKSHTARQVRLAWMNGKLFHHTPRPLRPLRDFVLDHTPLLQKVVGDASPREINSQLALIEDAPPTTRG
jgi:2-polyprenyl-6-methoxyphenol hydroxylase-like FAD-dependent oxidoreductase